MFIVGLTGGIGSGKSTVADAFNALGVDIIDADIIARDVVKPGQQAYEKIKNHFGASILNEDKTLNRKALRERVFKNQQDKQWLEQCLHPIIRNEIKRQCYASTTPYCIAVIPLLIESGRYEYINRICVVDATPKLQMQRAMQRDAQTQEQIEAIIASQATREQRLEKADDVIDNTGSLTSLTQQVQHMHHFYLNSLI